MYTIIEKYDMILLTLMLPLPSWKRGLKCRNAKYPIQVRVIASFPIAQTEINAIYPHNCSCHVSSPHKLTTETQRK